MRCESCGKPIGRNWGLKLCPTCMKNILTKPIVCKVCKQPMDIDTKTAFIGKEK